MNAIYKHLQFTIETSINTDDDADMDYDVANIYIDDKSLAIQIQEHIGAIPLPSKELDDTEAIYEFSGLSPDYLLMNLLNLRYVYMPSNGNFEGKTLLLDCSCGAPYCSPVRCKIEENNDDVLWCNFHNGDAPTKNDLLDFPSFRFTKKNYQDQLEVLQKWVDKKGCWKEGDLEENMPSYE